MSGRLLRALTRVGSGTLASRVLGFVRDVVVARAFGAGTGADAFFVAFRIPNLLRRLFAEGAFSQAFVPVITEYRERRSREEVRDLVGHVAGALLGAVSVVTLVGVAAAPVLILLFAPGFSGDSEKYALAVTMVRITFPYIAFISLASLAAGLLNAYGRFAAPAYAPVLLNDRSSPPRSGSRRASPSPSWRSPSASSSRASPSSASSCGASRASGC